MIYYQGNKALIARFKVINIHIRHVVSEVYNITEDGAKLVWIAIRSCFGAGYWVNDKPWLNTEGWKNGR